MIIYGASFSFVVVHCTAVHTTGSYSTSTSAGTDTWEVITSIFVPLAFVAIIIITAVVCKSYQRKKNTNGEHSKVFIHIICNVCHSVAGVDMSLSNYSLHHDLLTVVAV